MDEPQMHPVQTLGREKGEISSLVTLRAYEVYCHIYGPQKAMIEGWCRGGFRTGELICFLYARSFPQTEWRERFHEAMKGMKNV